MVQQLAFDRRRFRDLCTVQVHVCHVWRFSGQLGLLTSNMTHSCQTLASAEFQITTYLRPFQLLSTK